MNDAAPLCANTATKLGDGAAVARVLVCGSHGGVYPAYLACLARVRALILNDAGIGKDCAGVACLDYCSALGMAAAVIDHRSARIGDAGDMLARGTVSALNRQAEACGVAPGIDCAAAARLLAAAPQGHGEPPPYSEARTLLDPPVGPLAVWLLDSASLVRPEDAGQIVITGSHGGLIGANPAAALRADVNVRAALFNDAGIGADRAGIGRLPALAERGIAAATVAAASARIGDAASSYRDGVLSCVNAAAAALGVAPGQSAQTFLGRVQRRHRAGA